MSIQSTIKNGIEEFGSKALNAPVTVETVSVSLFTGHGELRNLAAGNPAGTVQVWDLQQRLLALEISADGDRTFPAFFLPRANHLVLHHFRDNAFHEWDLTTGKEVRSWKVKMRPGPFSHSALSPDGAWFFALDDDDGGRLRHLASGQEFRLNLHLKQVGALVFSPDSTLLAVGGGLGAAALWETATLKQTAIFHGFLQGLHSIAFSPDGARLALGSNAKEAVKLWDVQSRQELLTLEGQGSKFDSTAFSPDGNLIGACNSRGLLHLWTTPTLDEIDKLSHPGR